MESRPRRWAPRSRSGPTRRLAHLGELHQHGGGALGVGARRRPARRACGEARQRRGDQGRTTLSRRPMPRAAPRPSSPRCCRPGTIADALPSRTSSAARTKQPEVLSCGAPRLAEVLVHGDDLGAGHEGRGPSVSPTCSRRAHQHDADAVLDRRPGERPRRSRPAPCRRHVASTATEEQPAPRATAARPGGSSRSRPRRPLAILVPAATGTDHVPGSWRPGKCRHTLRGGPAQAPRRRQWLRPMALDFFFFGTAMDGLQRSVRVALWGVPLMQRLGGALRRCKPLREGLPEPRRGWTPVPGGQLPATSRPRCGLACALGQEPDAVLFAQGRHRQLEHDGVAHESGARVPMASSSIR